MAANIAFFYDFYTFPRRNRPLKRESKAIDFAYNTLVPLIFDNEIELLSNMD